MVKRAKRTIKRSSGSSIDRDEAKRAVAIPVFPHTSSGKPLSDIKLEELVEYVNGFYK